MSWKDRDPPDSFFRRMAGFHAARADDHPDPAERELSKAEVERLNSLIGAFGRTEPK